VLPGLFVQRQVLFTLDRSSSAKSAELRGRSFGIGVKLRNSCDSLEGYQRYLSLL
jgi:hypothetical protein